MKGFCKLNPVAVCHPWPWNIPSQAVPGCFPTEGQKIQPPQTVFIWLNRSGLELIPIGNAHLLWYCMCTWISIKGQNNQLESPQPDPPNKNYQHHASSWNVTVTIHVRSNNHFSPASSIIILLKDLSFTLIPMVSGHLQSSIYHIEGFGRFPPSKPTLRNILHLLHHLAMSSLRFRSSEKKSSTCATKKTGHQRSRGHKVWEFQCKIQNIISNIVWPTSNYLKCLVVQRDSPIQLPLRGPRTQKTGT